MSMLTLIDGNRDFIERRTQAELASQAIPRPSPEELERGIPILLDQLVDTLRPGQMEPDFGDVVRVAGAFGARLSALGFTVSELVHGYGAVCEAVMALAAEKRVRISAHEFEMLNRTLDAAIAGAVDAYQTQRTSARESQEFQNLGMLAHELRNALSASVMAFDMIKKGRVGTSGRTAEALDHNLARIGQLLDRALVEVRLHSDSEPIPERLRLADVLDQVVAITSRDAERLNQRLDLEVDHTLEIETDRQLLTSAISNLVQNALKYTRPAGWVSLRARAVGDRLRVEVEDECGGLAPEKAAAIFQPAVRGRRAQPGVGLGLSIVQRSVTLLGGTVRLTNFPGKGCIFAIEVPRVLQEGPAPT